TQHILVLYMYYSLYKLYDLISKSALINFDKICIFYFKKFFLKQINFEVKRFEIEIVIF
ncbi:hypothetical protein C2G38_2127649, partial [Gigaspora rosea]